MMPHSTQYDIQDVIDEMSMTGASFRTVLLSRRLESEDTIKTMISSIVELPVNINPNGLRDRIKNTVLESFNLNNGNFRKTAAALNIPKSTLHDWVSNWKLELNTNG